MNKTLTIIIEFCLLLIFGVQLSSSIQIQCKSIILTISGQKDEFYNIEDSRCKKCESAIVGCISCDTITVNSNLFVVCDICFDGFFLLQRCGEHCQSCNLKHGCEKCAAEDQNMGWVSAKLPSSQQYYWQTFRQCKECKYSKRCYKCNPNDINICTDCNAPVNQLVPYSGIGAQCGNNLSIKLSQQLSIFLQAKSLIRIATFMNMVIAITVLYVMTITIQEYIITPNIVVMSKGVFNVINFLELKILNIDRDGAKCIIPTDSNYCNICTYGLSTGENLDGYNSCLECNQNNGFNMERIRCSFIDYNQEVSVTGCRDAYAEDDQCKTSCGAGRYGVAVYNFRAKLDQSYCASCHSSCYECGGSSADSCKSCNKGYYLQLTDRTVQMGTCQPKQEGHQDFQIYVNPWQIFNSKDSDQQDGSYKNAFNSIQDGLANAYELGASYTSATVEILLKDGGHAMVRNKPTDKYMPLKLDQYSATTQVIIRPEDGADQININYKLRDSFKFKVGGSLTLQNLKFDAIDSSVDMALDQIFLCSQNNIINCCRIDADGDYAGGLSCFFTRKPTEECYGAFGTSFIQFEINKNSMLTVPPTLTIENFIYEYNSLIELNEYGGHIKLTNVTFDNMNSCGAIIRNKFAYITPQIEITDLKTAYQSRSSSYQATLFEEYQQSISNLAIYQLTCQNKNLISGLNPCHTILIENSNFTNFGKMKEVSTYPVAVDPQYKLQIQGMIIDLDGFQGTLKLLNNEFNTNLIKYESCLMAQYIDQLTLNPEDNYPTYGAKTTIQIKTWISLVNHGDWSIDIVRNTFKYMTSVKGLIYLDLGPRSSNSPVLIAMNTFFQNGAYFDSSVIHIKARGGLLQNVFKDIPLQGDMFCTGYHFEQNVFEKNYGCFKYSGGAIKFQCLNQNTPDSSLNGLVDYQDIDWFFQAAHYKVDYSLYFENFQEKTYYEHNFKIDPEVNRFRSNVFKENLGTGNQGLINIIGSPRTFFENDTYLGNGESSLESTTAYGKTKYIKPSEEIEKLGFTLHLSQLTDPTNLMRTMIYIRRSEQLKIINCTFEYNWLYEPFYYAERTQLIEIRDFYGQFHLDGWTVKNQIGMLDNPYGPVKFGVAAYPASQRDKASLHPLLRFTGNQMMKAVDHFKTFTYMKNIQYQEFNNPDGTLFPYYDRNSDNDVYIHITNITMNNAYFQDIDCHLCSRPWIRFQSEVTTLNNVTFKNINGQTLLTGHYSTAPFIMFFIRKIYFNINYSPRLITEKIIFNEVKLENFFATEGSRMFEIQRQAVLGDIIPTDYQIFIENSSFSGAYSYGSAPLFKIDGNWLQLWVFNSSFNNITSGYQASGGYNGAAFLVQQIRNIHIEKVTAIDIMNPASQFDGNFTIGCGRFLCFLDPVYITLVNITDSFFLGETMPIYQQKSEDQIYQIKNELYHQASMFEFRLAYDYITLTIIRTTFFNCSVSRTGSSFFLRTTGIKTIDIVSSHFQGNAAITGGAIFCSDCYFTIFNTSFDTNVAKYGSDLHLLDPIIPVITLESINSRNSYSLLNGGSIHIKDTSSIDYFIKIIKGTGENSSFTNSYAANDGGAIFLEIKGNLYLDIYDTYFENIQAGQNGGVIMVPQIQYAVQIMYITLKNCVMNNIQLKNGGGGAFYVNDNANILNLKVYNSSFTKIKSSKNGGLVYSGAQLLLDLSFSNVTVDDCQALNGGLIYFQTDLAYVKILDNSTIKNSKAQLNGGVLYINNPPATLYITLNSVNISGSSAQEGAGGVIYASATYITYEFDLQTNITNSYANRAGVLFTNASTQWLNIYKTTFNYSESKQETGGFYVYSRVTTNLKIDKNCSMRHFKSGQNGGVFYIHSRWIWMTVKDLEASNTSSNDHGGFLVTSDTSKFIDIEILNSSFHNTSALEKGSFLYIRAADYNDLPSVTIDIRYTQFSCRDYTFYDQWPTGYINIVQDLENGLNLIAGLFSFDPLVTGEIISITNEFSRCFNTYEGSIFAIPKLMRLDDTSSFYELNGGLNGLVSAQSSLINLNNAYVKDSLSKYSGFVHMVNNASVSINKLRVKLIKTLQQGGAFYTEGYGQTILKILDCQDTIQYFDSQQNGAFMYNSNPQLDLNITNCEIAHVYSAADGGLLYFESGDQIKLYNVTLKNVSAYGQGGFLYSTYPDMFINVTKVNLTCTDESDYDIIDINIDVKRNKSSQGSMFYLKNIQDLYTKDNYFANCKIADKGGIFYLEDSWIEDRNSTYIQNVALQGGIFYFKNAKISLYQTKINSSLAYSGGSFYLVGSNNLTIQGMQVYYSESVGDGGFIYILDPTARNDIALIEKINYTVSINNLMSRQGNGGTFYIDCPLTYITLNNIEIRNTSALLSGGFANIQNAKTLYITSSQIYSASSINHGSIVYSSSNDGTFVLDNSVFDCQGQTFPQIDTADKLTNMVFTNGGAFYLKSAKNIDSNGNTYQNCYVAEQGGIFQFVNTNFKDINSIYRNNAALIGGVFVCINCDIYLKNIKVYNQMANKGGFIYIEDNVNLTLDNFVAEGAKSIVGGGFAYAIQKDINSKGQIIFKNNGVMSDFSSQYNGGGFFIDHKEFSFYIEDPISIQNSNALNGNGGLFYILNGRDIQIQDSTFIGFSASGNGSMIYSNTQTLNLTLVNNVIKGSTEQWSNYYGDDLNVTKKGGAIYVKDLISNIISSRNQFGNTYIAHTGSIFTLINSTLNDSYSSYQYSKAKLGGAIYCDNCKLNLKNIGFDHNQGYYGGSLYVINHKDQLNIIDCTFTNQLSQQHGGILYQNGETLGEIQIINPIITVSESSNQGGAFYLNNPNSIITVRNMILGSTYASKEGGVFYINKASELYIIDSQFHNFSSQTKGSLMYSTSANFKLKVINSKIFCRIKSFNYTEDLAGNIDSILPYITNAGAIYVSNAMNVSVMYNQISNCYLSDTGGVYTLKNTSLDDDSNIYKNNAAFQGGVLYSESSNVTVNNATINNSYSIYGGVYYLKQVNPLNITNSSFTFNNAIKDGGFAYLTDDGAQSNIYQLQINKSLISDSQSGISGGVFYVNSKSIRNITFNRIDILRSKTTQSGGVAHIESMNGTMTITTENGLTNSISEFEAKGFGSLVSSLTSQNFSLSLNNMIVQARSIYSKVKVEQDVLFQTSSAGAFYIQSSRQGVVSFNNIYRNCYTGLTGGVFTLIDSQLVDYGSRFYQNAAISGGVFKCDSCTLKLNSTNIQNNYAQNGGAFLLDNKVKVDLFNTILSYNEAVQRGGVFSIVKTAFGNSGDIYLQIQQSTSITGNIANEGGFINVENEYMSINISNSKLESISAKEQGGLINALKANSITFLSCKINDFQAENGAGIYSTSETVSISITKSSIICNQLFDISTIGTYLNRDDQQTTQQSNFFIQKAVKFTSELNKFQSCGVAELGGVFYLQKTNFFDTKSTFSYNAGAQGGVFLIIESNVSLIQTDIQNNYAYQGGVMSVYQDSYIYLFSCQFINNIAYSLGGVLNMNTQSYFNIVGSLFQKNYAPESSVISVLGGSTSKNNTILNSNIISNNATTNTLSMMYGNIVIKSSSFENNNATFRSKNIFLGFANAVIENTKFTSLTTSDELESVNSEFTIGTFIYIIFDVDISISSCIFQNGRSSLGGAIYISGDSNIRISSSQFLNNYAKLQGGAIYSVGFKNLEITGGSIFKNNLAIDQGDDIFASNTENTLTLDKVNITNPNAKCSIFAEQLQITISRTGFKNIKGKGSENGAALYCSNCKKINISESNFINLESKLGGAIFITETEVNKKSSEKWGKYLIIDSSFEQCKATQTGGAIYLDNSQYMTIQSTLFKHNQALYSKTAINQDISGAGGAIYFTCNEQVANCKFDIIRMSTFQQNTAGVKGGAIYWDVIEPIFVSSDIKFKDNSAKYYANDVACFSQQLDVISEVNYQKHLKAVGLLESLDFRDLIKQEKVIKDSWQKRTLDGIVNDSQGKVESLRSGGSIPVIYLAHVDKYGQIVGSDFSSKVRVSVNSSSNTDPKALVFPPSIEGSTSFEASAGIAIVKDFSFAATPGFSYSLSFSSDGINTNKLSNKNFLKNSAWKTNLDTDVIIELRDCELGEQYTTGGKCMSCPNGQSFSLAKMTEPGECSTCPTEKAVCNGGSNIGPKSGYWRKNNYTSTFVKCLYSPACLGMVPPDFNPKGSCSEGYQNILCSDCKIGFSRTNDYECQLCPDKIQNILRLVFIFIGLVLVVIFIVRSTLIGAKEKNNITSIFMKILLNHIQLILLTASFDFEWPSEVLQLFDTAKPVAAISTQIVSFDCFLDQREEKYEPDSSISVLKESDKIRIFFQKQIFLAVLPFVLTIFSVLAWQLIRLVKRNQLEISGRTISTMVIVLFLIHPNIVQYMFYNFKCIEVDFESRVLNDLEIMCWNDQHRIFSYFVAAPSIIVWGVGIPAFALIIMNRFKRNLDQIEIREKFGFLYRGYRTDFYFWEIVIMYRKMLLIFIAVFIGNLGVIAQALIVFVVLIVFLIINLKKKPYGTIALNDLETLSLVTSMISVYCGLFFIANKPEDWIRDNPDYSSGSIALTNASQLFFFGVIVFCNLTFLIYWAVKMYFEIRAKFRKILPKVYLVLCLCMDKNKFDHENKTYEMQLVNESLKEQYLKNLSALKNMYYSGEIMLNQQNLEKLLTYLNPQTVKELTLRQTEGELQEQEKFNKRWTRIQEDQVRAKLGYNKVQDYKAAQDIGLIEQSPKAQHRLESAKTNFSRDKRSILIDQAFILEDTDKKRPNGSPETQQDSMIVKTGTQNHQNLSDQGFNSFESHLYESQDSEYQIMSTGRELLIHLDENESGELASIYFSEIDHYDKELKLINDIKKLDEQNQQIKQIDEIGKIARRKRLNKKRSTQNYESSVNQHISKSPNLQQKLDEEDLEIEDEKLDEIKDSVQRKISVEILESDNSYEQVNPQFTESDFNHLSLYKTPQTNLKMQNAAKQVVQSNNFLQVIKQQRMPSNRQITKEQLEIERENELKDQMSQATLKRFNFKKQIRTESQMMLGDLSTQNLDQLFKSVQEQALLDNNDAASQNQASSLGINSSEIKPETDAKSSNIFNQANLKIKELANQYSISELSDFNNEDSLASSVISQQQKNDKAMESYTMIMKKFNEIKINDEQSQDKNEMQQKSQSIENFLEQKELDGDNISNLFK